MRWALLALALAVALGGGGCADDDDEGADGGATDAPLTLEQRVPGEAEAPESQPDPVETPRTATGADEFLATMAEDLFVNASAAEKQQFAEGLVSGVQRTRFFPDEPEGQHSRELPHLVAFVAEYGTEDAAQNAVEFLNEDGGRPCPEECALDVETFEVDGVPDANGLHRYATQEEIDEVGTDERPHDSYAISFASGTFAYWLDLAGAPGSVTEEQAEAIAEKLYERVS
jgi:hypothetical protein